MPRGGNRSTLAAFAAALFAVGLITLGTGLFSRGGPTPKASSGAPRQRAALGPAGQSLTARSGNPSTAVGSRRGVSSRRLVSVSSPASRRSATSGPIALHRPTSPPARQTSSSAGGSVATMLYDATGYTPAQVTSEPVCTASEPGHASCDSEALVSKDTGAAVHPLTEALHAAPVGAGSSGARGQASAVQVGSPVPYTPSFIQEAYDTGWLSATAGVGQTVAIVDAYGDTTAASDLATFRAAYGLPALSTCTASSIAAHNSGGPCLTVASQTGQTSSSSLPNPNSNPADQWEPEESLDLDAVSSACPNCNILFIETKSDSLTNLAAGDAEAVKLGVKLISNSFGGAESGDGNQFSNAEKNAGTGLSAGVETFASTGDDGAYADGQYPGQTNDNMAPYPASEPGITAVGGTTLDPSAGARGINELAWSGAGSACSTFDSQPSWQASANTGCSGRAVADISADADPNTGLKTYDSYNNTKWGYYGGTSLAAPLAAAYVALTSANSTSTPNSDGSLSAEWAYADAAELNDVTSGSNGSGCSASLTYAHPQTCTAGVGWDGPTGMGSISGDVVTSSAGPSLTVPPQGGVDNGSNGFSILQSLSGASATFDGGVYPNGSSTNVWWQYGSADATNGGTSFSASSSTAPQSVGGGAAPVAATPTTVTGLASNAVYYVEQCASNNGGADTTCGNVMEFTTGTGPAAQGSAAITATNLGYGGQLSLTSQPSWSPSATVQYQWQESADGSTNWSNVGTATSNPTAYTLQVSDSQQYIRVNITATAASTTTTDYSNSLQVQRMVPQASNPTLSATNLGFGGQISVATPSWSPPATTVSYQWQESVNGTGGWTALGAPASTNAPYTIQLSDSQQYIRVEVTGSNTAGQAVIDSNAVQVQNLTPVAAGPATLTDTSLGFGGQISLSNSPTWSPGSPTVTYQWQESADNSSWTSLGSASSSLSPYTIQAADSQQYIRTQIVATDAAGTTTVYSNVLHIQNLAPEASNPTLSDTSLGLGGLISATTPTWSPAANTVSYQWQESNNGTGGWTALGAPASTNGPYTITLADSQQYIRIAMTGTNGAGPTTINSTAVQVADLSPVASGNPTISETGLGIGDVISVATTPTWSPGSPTLLSKWQESSSGTSGWHSIADAGSPYTIQLSDSQQYIRLAVIATDAAGTITAASSPVQVENFAPTVTGSATISDDKLDLGGVLSVDDSLDWSGADTVTNQWQESSDDSNWFDINGATGTSYTIQPGDTQKYIRVEITGTNGGGSTPFDTDALQVNNLAPATNNPTLLDTDMGVGGQLSVAVPNWSPAATTVAYQWQESSDNGTWTTIAGATGSGYTIQVGDSQQYVRLAITGANASGSTTVDSNSLRVENLTPVATGPLTISSPGLGLGLGNVISVAATPTWSPGSPSLTYQWQESSDNGTWTTIAGATGSGYTIQQSDSQKYIRAEVIATDAAGTATVYSSSVQVQNLSGPVTGNTEGSTPAATITGRITVIGQASVGATISVGGGFSTSDGSVTFTFKRCARTCTTVQSGTRGSYRLRTADAGYFLIAYVAGAAGKPDTSSLIGPIASPNAGSLKITRPSTTIKSGRHTPLLSVARTIVKPSKTGKPSTYKLTLTHAAKAKGSVSAWACLLKNTKLVSCTRPVKVTKTATLSESVAAGETVEVVALH